MKKISFAAALIAACLTVNIASAQTITLDKAEKLVPQGWSVADDDLKFKKNTTAELNADGELISGVLNSDTYLRPAGWKNLINDYCYVESSNVFFPRFFRPFGLRYGMTFPTYGHIRYKSGEKVTFAKDGTVLAGVIDEKATVAIQQNKYGFVDFKDDSLLVFNEDGRVERGVLDKDTRLRPVGWEKGRGDSAGFLEFKGGREIEFSPEGLVTKGTLVKAAAWKNAAGETITLPAKKILRFIDDGVEVLEK